MTVKNSTKYAKLIPAGLTGQALLDAITELLGPDNSNAKDVESIRNTYAQLPAANDDLLGESAPAKKKAAKKATKPVAKKKAATKPVAKKKAASGSREPREGTTYILFRELIKGATKEAALKAALKAYPKAPTNAASAAWCASQINCKTPYAQRYIDHFKK